MGTNPAEEQTASISVSFEMIVANRMSSVPLKCPKQLYS
jgi:hypothetical protein